MTDDAVTAGPDQLDAWLDNSGFVDVALGAWTGAIDEADLDDPWADKIRDVPTLTDAQRSFLLGDIISAADDIPTSDDLERASHDIIEIPSDPDDIAPFDG